jgi:hypothetical protein
MSLLRLHRDRYLRRLREATVGGWRVALPEAVDALKRIMTRRGIRFVDAGGGRTSLLQVHLLVLQDRQASLIFHRRPWSRTFLSIDGMEASAEPLVDSLLSHLEEELGLATFGPRSVDTGLSDSGES